ncbi:hypothetical protein [Kribbella turkmenica]|uniref:hypothetical protein n=1 Tax=Kribbella turkmenica TaxID=2530375 RepID=UPI00140522E0|nr:hypothetical protein [Kribbella turkmenica]
MIGRAVVLLVVAGAGFVAGWVANDASPHCPTEDACTVDYRDGEWHITELPDN